MQGGECWSKTLKASTRTRDRITERAIACGELRPLYRRRWNGVLRRPAADMEGRAQVARASERMSIEHGQEAARLCGLNLLAQVRMACGGDLSRVRRVIRLGVFVNSADAFIDQPKVANGASDLMVEVFGEVGRHARSAVGVNVLPLGVSVEVDGIFEIEPHT